MLSSNKKNSPYSWHRGNTSTFAEQAKNLGEQVGDQGLNTGQIDIQKKTGEAYQKAGESGQNVAAGADKAAEGATVDPTVAQAPDEPNKTGIANPKVEPYKIIKEGSAAPDTNITTEDIGKNANYDSATEAYLNKLFNGDIPDSVRDAMDKSLQKQGGNEVINPQWEDAQRRGVGSDILSSIPKYIPGTETLSSDTGLVNSFNDYLASLSKNYANQANSPQDVEQYKNYLQNMLSDKLNELGQNYQTQEGNIATQKSDKGKAISDYIEGLQNNLSDYQKRTGDLSNVGNLSDVEQLSAAHNAILADPNANGLNALSALGGSSGNSRLGLLSQQSENAAINQAEAQATQAQQTAKAGQEAQVAGKKAQNAAYDAAGNKITKTQTGKLKDLDASETAAQKALTDTYNTSKSRLNDQEKDYVNHAQDTLKNSKVPPETVKNATAAFANSISNTIDKGNLNDQEKQQLGKQLESIWRIAVGSNPSDMHYSDEIAGLLIPLYQKLGYKPQN